MLVATKPVLPQIKIDQLDWLTDAALFIDENLVERFYDAIVRPKYELSSIQFEEAKTDRSELKAALGINAEVSIPSWLANFFDAKAGVKGEVEASQGSEKTNRQSEEKKPIRNAQRKLEELAVHYLDKYLDRLLSFEIPLATDTEPGQRILGFRSPYLLKTPRALAFMDLPAQTKLIPTAVEFENGKIELIYNSLATKWSQELRAAKKWTQGEIDIELIGYPDHQDENHENLREERKAYWEAYQRVFSAQDAMVEVEKASQENGRIRWIDFRLPISDAGDTMHLHVCPGGNYDAGVFGYNFIKRGYKHGLRIVGTLKSEPDMNVMAIYEK